MKKFQKSQPAFLHSYRNVVLLGVTLTFAIYSAIAIWFVGVYYNNDRSLVLLAEQFSKGKIALLPNADLPIGDISDYKSNYYLYFGPFASLILIPFVFVFGKQTPEVFVGIISLCVSFLTVYSLTKKLGFKVLDALWLSLFFVFSTVLLGSSLLVISAYQVEALGVPCVLLALNEYFGKRRSLLIGIFMALAVLTRVTLALGIVFF